MNILKFDSEISIGKKKISKYDPVYFIADIAANHDGDIERAKNLIYLAKESGADCVKFQHFLAEKIVSDYGFKSLKTRQSHQSSWEKSVFEIYKEYECKRDWTDELVKTCKDAQIEFMTTPYDYDILNEINHFVNAYKIGSGDITWHEFLCHIAKLNKPLLLACGAATFEEVELALIEISKYNRKIVLMQCNTNYTADYNNFKYLNLNVIKTFKEKFNNIILGLSDHTLGHTAVMGAVTLGARVIEKHFTDDNNRVGPDHKFAMNPNTWKEMVIATRELEFALGDGIKRIEDNEKDTVVIQRRSIRLIKNLQVGDTITENDIEFLRPAPISSYAPYEKEKVIGKKINVSKSKGDCILRKELYS